MFSRMDMRGLSEEYGSWKTICMLRRSRWRARRLDQDTSRPSNSTVPPSASSSPSRSRAVVDLPQPDSPTMPSVWPVAMLKLTPSTAETTPALRKPRWTLNSLHRSRTCKRGVLAHVGVDAMVVMGWASAGGFAGPLLLCALDIERFVDGIAKEVKRHGGGEDKQTWYRHDPWLHIQGPTQRVQHIAPFGRRRLRPQPEEAEASGGEDAHPDQPGGVHEDGAEDVRQQLLHDQLGRAGAAQAGSLDVLLHDLLPRRHQRDARDRRDEHEAEGDDRVLDPRPQRGADRNGQQQRREGVEHVHRAHQERRHPAAQVARRRAGRCPEHGGNAHRYNPRRQRNPAAV